MDRDDPVKRGTERALFLLAQKRSESVFNELLDYASEVCLTNSPTYLGENDVSRYDSSDPETVIIQKLGARAFAVLLEMESGVHLPPVQEEGEPAPAYTIGEVIMEPASISGSLNMRVLENAERFGQALIDESFAILGKDADKWVERLRNSHSNDQEYSAMAWLDQRITEISNKSRSESSREDEAAHFYPPYRISPKIIGTYPNIDVQPSCLSASVIAASFFAKANIPVLHAGVSTPSSEIGSHILRHTLVEAVKHEFAEQRPEQDQHIMALGGLALKTKKYIERPLAQHGAIYAKLHSGWIQFDPYNNANAYLHNEENEHFDSLYEKLNAWHEIVPNLEFTTSTMRSYGDLFIAPRNGDLALTLSSFHYSHETELIQSIEDALASIPEESYQTYLYETCLRPLLKKEYNHLASIQPEDAPDFLNIVLNKGSEFDKNGDSPMLSTFDTTLQRFMFWKSTPEEFIEQCKNDAHYRRRRAEDFLAIPALMGTILAKKIAEADFSYTHLSIDVGNPAMRIGLTALSDFARYDYHPLPASFWATHWPGSASITENLDNPPASDNDWVILFNSLLSRFVHPFTSSHNYDKINSFISTYSPKEGQEDGTG